MFRALPSVSWGLVTTNCLYGFIWKLLIVCFFHVRSSRAVFSWAKSLLLKAAPLALTQETRHLLFCFSDDELLVVSSRRPLLNVQIRLPLITATKSRLSFFLPIMTERFSFSRLRRYFRHQWGGSGIIGRYQRYNLSCLTLNQYCFKKNILANI